VIVEPAGRDEFLGLMRETYGTSMSDAEFDWWFDGNPAGPRILNVARDDDVTKYGVRRKVDKAGKKSRFKAPKVQRLVTPVVRARRARKVKATIAGVRKSAQQRREYLTLISRERMVARQRKNALKQRQKTGGFKSDLAAYNKAGAPKAKAKAAAPKAAAAAAPKKK